MIFRKFNPHSAQRFVALRSIKIAADLC